MAEGGRFHKVFHTPPTLFYKTQHIHCFKENRLISGQLRNGFTDVPALTT
jgi:hypothetical protein